MQNSILREGQSLEIRSSREDEMAIISAISLQSNKSNIIVVTRSRNRTMEEYEITEKFTPLKINFNEMLTFKNPSEGRYRIYWGSLEELIAYSRKRYFSFFRGIRLSQNFKTAL